MVNVLLSVTFGCGVVIAVAHVANRLFVAPTYDVVANLVAFVSSTAASTLLGHLVPATLSALAVLCWLVLARRTWRAEPERRRRGQAPPGQAVPGQAAAGHASKSTDTSSLTG